MSEFHQCVFVLISFVRIFIFYTAFSVCTVLGFDLRHNWDGVHYFCVLCVFNSVRTILYDAFVCVYDTDGKGQFQWLGCRLSSAIGPIAYAEHCTRILPITHASQPNRKKHQRLFSRPLSEFGKLWKCIYIPNVVIAITKSKRISSDVFVWLPSLCPQQ